MIEDRATQSRAAAAVGAAAVAAAAATAASVTGAASATRALRRASKPAAIAVRRRIFTDAAAAVTFTHHAGAAALRGVAGEGHGVERKRPLIEDCPARAQPATADG